MVFVFWSQIRFEIYVEIRSAAAFYLRLEINFIRELCRNLKRSVTGYRERKMGFVHFPADSNSLKKETCL